MESAVDSVLQPGTILSGRYVIESVLGQGGMGSVYLAKISTLGDKLVAIKEMRLETLGTDAKSQKGAVEQFRQEAKFLANLEHTNLVQVSDFFEENGRNYLVMAYVKGETLGDLLKARKGAFTIQKVLEWAHQLCSVLQYLHTQNPPILFRDLKPSNIMLDEAGRIRLIDFGIARAFNPEGQTATFLQGMGSAGYSPLEQYQGAGGTDPRSDIYALGATLFHLLTNRQPPSPVELISEGKTMPSPRRWNPTLPPALEQVLLKMLATRKDDRYQSMADVDAALTRVEKGLDQEDGTEDLGPIQVTSISAPAVPSAPLAPARPSGSTVPAPPASAPSGYPVPVAATTAAMPGGSQDKALWVILGGLCTVVFGMFAMMYRSAHSGAGAGTVSPSPALVESTPKGTPPKPVVANAKPSPVKHTKPAVTATHKAPPRPVVTHQAAPPPPRPVQQPTATVVHHAPSLGDGPSVPTAVRRPKTPEAQPVMSAVPQPQFPPAAPPPIQPPAAQVPAATQVSAAVLKNWPAGRPKPGDPLYWNPPAGHPDHIEGAPNAPPPPGGPPPGARYDPQGHPIGGGGPGGPPGGLPPGGGPPGW